MKVYFRHEMEDAPGALVADVPHTELKDLYETLRANGVRDTEVGPVDFDFASTEFVYNSDSSSFYFEITWSSDDG